MWYKNDINILSNYITKMINNFKTSSVVPSICTMIKNNEIKNALKFSKKYDLGKMNPNTFYSFSRLVQSITWGEFNYIVDQLKKSSSYIQEYKMPDKNIINTSISKIIGVKPDIMIVPVDFFVNMHQWGMKYEEDGTPPVIKYEDKIPYYYYDDETKLRIIWANKAININEIIISKKENNIWEYKTYSETNERIYFNFEHNIDTDYLFYESLFKYYPPKDDKIFCIKYSTTKEITKSEKNRSELTGAR